MSTGTNKERISQNNEIISENNANIFSLKEKINNLPTSGDTTATPEDLAEGKTAVSKGIRITGTLKPPESLNEELTLQEETIAELMSKVQGKAGVKLKIPDGMKFSNSTFTEFTLNIDTSEVTAMNRMFSGCQRRLCSKN